VNRIENVEADIRSMMEDRKGLYIEARAAGLDQKVLKTLIRQRRLDQAELDLFQDQLSIYRRALEQ
jgi:uncharacterized protein (UPF0335 family)